MLLAKFLKREPSKFESTLDRWERKGLVRRIGQTSKAPMTSQGKVGRLRQVWDKVTDSVLAHLEILQAELDDRRGVQRPNRWRLRRLYLWQQRQQPLGPRETYDEIAKLSLRTERS